MTLRSFDLSNRAEILKNDPLRDFFVWWREPITKARMRAFKTCVERATSEAPIQRFLEKHPMFLVLHLRGGHGRWVIPQKRLGSEYVTDFMIGEKHSGGHRWTAVELESPRARLFTKHGVPSKALNQGMQQIRDWRSWLQSNRDYAMHPRSMDGLGLTDISASPTGLLLIGRRSLLQPDDKKRRLQLEQDSNVRIQTYDWLIEWAGASVRAE